MKECKQIGREGIQVFQRLDGDDRGKIEVDVAIDLGLGPVGKHSSWWPSNPPFVCTSNYMRSRGSMDVA